MSTTSTQSDTALEAWRLLLVTHHRLTRLMDHNLREAHDLKLEWYDVLYQLRSRGGRLRMHELAEATLFSRTDCTRIVDRLERAGLVRREPATEDGRGVYAVLTAAGSTKQREAGRTHLADIEALFTDRLSQRQAHAVAEALARVAFE